jgi:glycosyltransferase involved in cell wall biosynthesis
MRGRFATPDDFVAIYFGAMGRANGLHYILDAAKVLQQRGQRGIKIILHGAGSERASLVKRMEEQGLDNIVFSAPVANKAKLAQLVATANVCLTIYAGEDREQSWSPNKFFDALAAAKPILVNVGGWLAELVEKNACGKFVDPRHPDSLADALIELSSAHEETARMGERARMLAEGEFCRDRLGEQLEALLKAEVGLNSSTVLRQPHGSGSATGEAKESLDLNR